MRRVLISLLLVISLLAVSAIPVFADGPTGPQIWSLDGDNQMEKNYGLGDDGQSGSVTVPAGGSQVFLADEVALADVTYPGGAWVLFLSTDADWSSNCDVEIGYDDGSFNSLTSSATVLTRVNSYGAGPDYYIITKRVIQDASIMIPDGSYLALQITNTSGSDRVVYTAEGTETSYLRSPETDPGYPLPEIAAGVLLALGLAGLGAFIIIRRRSTRTDHA